MTLDRYSKAVSTIIAICLVWICLRDLPLVRRAQAAPSEDYQNVRIIDVRMQGLHDDTQYSLPVRIQK